MAKRKRYRKKKSPRVQQRVVIETPEEKRKRELKEKKERGRQKYLKALGHRRKETEPLPVERRDGGVLYTEEGVNYYSGIGLIPKGEEQ